VVGLNCSIVYCFPLALWGGSTHCQRTESGPRLSRFTAAGAYSMAPPLSAFIRQAFPWLDETPTQDKPATAALGILARQAAVTAVSTSPQQPYTTTNDAGAIVGIVLGSVAAFLLLCWVLYSCLNSPKKDEGDHGNHRRSHGEHHHHHHHHHHRERCRRSHRRRSHSRPRPPRPVIEVYTTSTTRPAAVYSYEKRRPDLG
jgi:hypothetical protein